MKGRFKIYSKWSPVVEIINIQVVPKIRMQRNDLEYQIEQTEEYHIIYVDTDGKIETDSFGYLPDIEIVV